MTTDSQSISPRLNPKDYPKAESADIVLLLEGTYPFVRGGVSSWVHQIIQGFPEYRFAAIFLGSEPNAYAGIRYALPANLVHLEVHYLFHHQNEKPKPRFGPNAEALADLYELCDSFAQTGKCGQPLLIKVATHLMEGRLNEGHFQDSHQAWELISALYHEQGKDTSFLDYFWTLKSLQTPLWKIVQIAQNLIPGRCYHTVSTGYAGLLGTLLSLVHHRPLLLSEHGLYTKERKIDLLQSSWIRETGKTLGEETAEGGVLRKLWIRFFESLGYATYATAHQVISLFEGIRTQQMLAGATQERTQCIPNGIALSRFKRVQQQPQSLANPIFTLIGRVVPIKDIKTFIRGMSLVRRNLPEAIGWIVGPTEEDPAYYEECLTLVESLGMKSAIQFLGFQSIESILASTSVLALSSISEALPLTLLESFAAGVPVVATDVGSCRQLILGQPGNNEDMALGAAGRIVGICNPSALANALVGLYTDKEEWNKARAAGMQRVERFYTEDKMFASYRNLYSTILG